jgi:hypothetical protein
LGSSQLREQADQPSRQSAVHHSFRLIGRLQLPIGETKTTSCAVLGLAFLLGDA